jgi:serine/threonine protein phosphatase 1
MKLPWLRASKTTTQKHAPSVPAGQRVYAIGDVHGCASLLNALLNHIEHDVASRNLAEITLVYLGDYIDRGPDSASVLALVGQDQPFAHRTIRIKGNHEEMLEQFLADPNYGASWRHYGGPSTLASYGVDPRLLQAGKDYDRLAADLARAIPQDHLQLVQSLTYSHTIGDYFFCHAGVRPGIELAHQKPADLCWIRDEFLSSTMNFGSRVIHGHSPVEAPDVHPNRINVDTGAYATGNLTCAVIEADQVAFLTVDARHVVER